MSKKSLSRQMRRQQERNRKAQISAEKRMAPQITDMLKKREERYYEVQVELYFTMFGLALEEMHGFKKKRVIDTWKRVDEYMSMVQDGKETLESLKELLRERAGAECSFN